MKACEIEMKDIDFIDLYDLLNIMDEQMCNYNFLITDYECYPEDEDIINKFNNETVWISGEEFLGLLQKEKIQWIWCVISAFDMNINYDEIIKEKIPYADGNREIWNTVELQHALAEFEIIVGDNTLLIVKAKKDKIVENILGVLSKAKEIL